MEATWNVVKSEVRGFRGEVRRIKFEIRNEAGDLYGTVGAEDDANVVAFGLNNGFLQSQFGGFAENVVTEIRRAMAGEKPASWAVEQ